MPRKVSEKSMENLKKGKATQFRSGDEAAKSGKKGGKASGKARRVYKTFREMSEDDTMEEKNTMWNAIKKLAMSGDLKAFEIYRDTIGEKPKDEVKVTNAVPVMIAGEEEIPE
ncbi:MAG: hypothetical protein K6G24_13275 [Lachnospiraceae bacterium]|nr:hypothetical protein [Lachnospiraceae bacterium]